MNWREDLYMVVMKAVREGLPGLKWIDMNRGQFSNPRKDYPVPLPCVLFEYDTVRYSEHAPEMRQGNGTLKVHYVCNAYADLHENSESVVYALAEFEILDTLTRSLCFIKGENNLAEILEKTNEQIARQTGQFIVYELTFELNVIEDHRGGNNMKRDVQIEKMS